MRRSIAEVKSTATSANTFGTSTVVTAVCRAVDAATAPAAVRWRFFAVCQLAANSENAADCNKRRNEVASNAALAQWLSWDTRVVGRPTPGSCFEFEMNVDERPA
jgi:hypothetical protein